MKKNGTSLSFLIAFLLFFGGNALAADKNLNKNPNYQVQPGSSTLNKKNVNKYQHVKPVKPGVKATQPGNPNPAAFDGKGKPDPGPKPKPKYEMQGGKNLNTFDGKSKPDPGPKPKPKYEMQGGKNLNTFDGKVKPDPGPKPVPKLEGL